MSTSQKHAHVYNFMKHNHMGVLSTVSAEGKPWGSAIYYVVDEKFNVYFVTRKETFKYQNLDKSSFAALTVADEENQQTVQLSGSISKVPPEDYLEVVFNRLAAIQPKSDLNWAPPIEKVYKGDYMPLCLTPTRLQYADFKEQSTDYHHKYIEEII